MAKTLKTLSQNGQNPITLSQNGQNPTTLTLKPYDPKNPTKNPKTLRQKGKNLSPMRTTIQSCKLHVLHANHTLFVLQTKDPLPTQESEPRKILAIEKGMGIFFIWKKYYI